MIPYRIKEVQWEFSSDDFISVKYSKEFSLYYIYCSDYKRIELKKDIWEIFKKDFPEHCIDIEVLPSVSDSIKKYGGM